MDIAKDPTLASLHKTGAVSTGERLLIATLKTKITGTPGVFLNILDYIRPPTMSSELQTQIQKEGKRSACLHLIRCAHRMASDTDNKITATADKLLDRLEDSMVPEEEEYEGCYYDSYCRCPACPDNEPSYRYHTCRSCEDCWQMCLGNATAKYGHSQVPYFLDYFYDVDELYRLCENELVSGSQLYADGLHPCEWDITNELNPEGYSRYDRRFCQTNLLWDMLGYMEQHHDTSPDQAPYYHLPGMGYGINYHWKAHVNDGSWVDELYQ